MAQVEEINYDKFLLRAHLLQVALGVGFDVYHFEEIRNDHAWVVLVSLTFVCVGLSGILFLWSRSVVAYAFLAIFNAAQVAWITTASATYGLVFGMHFNLSFSLRAVTVSLNLVALSLLFLSVIAWGDFLKRRAHLERDA